MRILFLSNTFGGLANFRFDLIKRLCDRGDKVILAYPFGMDVQQQDKENQKLFETWGCEFIDTPMSRKGTSIIEDFKLMLRYREVYKQVNPDRILSYTIKPNIYGALAKPSKMPFMMSITGLGKAVESDNLLARFLKMLYMLAIKRATKVFFQNQGNADFFDIPKEKVCLVPGSGVNLKRFALLPYPTEERVVFLFVARVMYEKGIDQFIDAAKAIRGKYPQTEFHVVGACDDEAYKAMLDQLQSEGIIIYHGQQKDMIKFQKMSSCAVHPSFYPEGMSNVLLEAAASGRPIITTDRSGCKEVIDDGVNGFICKQRDSQDLINQIEKFLALSWEERKNMGLAGRKKMEREFDREIVIDRYIRRIDE